MCVPNFESTSFCEIKIDFLVRRKIKFLRTNISWTDSAISFKFGMRGGVYVKNTLVEIGWIVSEIQAV